VTISGDAKKALFHDKIRNTPALGAQDEETEPKEKVGGKESKSSLQNPGGHVNSSMHTGLPMQVQGKGGGEVEHGGAKNRKFTRVNAVEAKRGSCQQCPR
jgi:hypothetical protein